ncbi:MAG TPA: LemA family protein [Bacilli bacterium]|nr:LemA family protein [Bacilli bacterium]
MQTWLWIVLILVGVLLLYVASTYNKLVVLRNKVKDQWSQIEVQLKKRFDLIPNLVETVKGYAKHEKETLNAVIEARNKFKSAKTPEDEMAASGDLNKALGRLMVLTEAYPELKANENFLQLQSDLKDVEEKIAFARQFYNDTVLTYNNKVQMFPSNIIAGMLGFKESKFFEAGEEAKEAPKVSF